MDVLVEVVAAVIVDDGLVLACRRAPHKDSAGLWEFPGGKVEPGETPQQSLARELREELSIGVTVGELVDRSATTVGDRTIMLSCYSTALVDERPTRSTDHDRLIWTRIAALPDLEWCAPDLPAVHKLVASS